eukprot:scaffold57545_cov33-Phaeocystis_antarctica.AAC.1
MKSSPPALSCWRSWDRTMDTVGTGRASQFRLSERQFGWRPAHLRRRRRPSISGLYCHSARVSPHLSARPRARPVMT